MRKKIFLSFSSKYLLFSITRRSYIEAKYVQKLFLRPLPAPNQMRSSTRTIKRWSVMKNSISSTNIPNENDDDISHSFKINNRQPLSRRLTSPYENEIALGKNFKKLII